MHSSTHSFTGSVPFVRWAGAFTCGLLSFVGGCTDEVPDKSQYVFQKLVAEPNTLSCDDGNPCTDGEKYNESGECKGGKVVQCNAAPADACYRLVCAPDPSNASSYACIPLTDDAKVGAGCDDSDSCTVGDKCVAGACVGAAKYCDDTNSCTKDTCDKSTDCVHTKLDAVACDDGDICTQSDTCKDGACLPAIVDNPCDDGNPCTDDTCDKKLGCSHANNAAGCDDGDACTGPDLCKAGICAGPKLDCLQDNNPCTDDACPVTAGAGCTHEPRTGPCDDGDACTTDEACVGTKCQTDSTLDCDDANVCTVDKCDKNTGCVHTVASLACSDGDTCTVGDFCDGGLCVGGANLPCNDGNPCTDDTCNPVAPDLTSACVHTANSAPCDDKNDCTIGDFCAGTKCSSGTPTVQTFDVGGTKEDKLSGVFWTTSSRVTFVGSRDGGGTVAMPVEVTQLASLQTMAVASVVGCGDGNCSASETSASCPVDCCGYCGDGMCQSACSESPMGCSADCVANVCGNSICESGETASVCAQDCGPAALPTMLPTYATITATGVLWEYGELGTNSNAVLRKDLVTGQVFVNTSWKSSFSGDGFVSLLDLVPAPSGGADLLVINSIYGASCGDYSQSKLLYVVHLGSAATVQSVEQIGDDVCYFGNVVASHRNGAGHVLLAMDVVRADGPEAVEGWAIKLDTPATVVAVLAKQTFSSIDPGSDLDLLYYPPTALAWSSQSERWLWLQSGSSRIATLVLTPDLKPDRLVVAKNPTGDSLVGGLVADGQGGFAALTTQYEESAPEFLRFDAWGNLVQAVQLNGADYVQPVSLLRAGAKWIIGGNIKLAGKKGQWWVGYVDDFGHGSCATAGACAGKLFQDCDDGNPCTSSDCDALTGACAPPQGATPCVDDYYACAAATCDPGVGCALPLPLCTDGDACTGDLCDYYYGCKHTPVSCDDGKPCTIDACDSSATGCTHTNAANASPCEDGDPCTGVGICFSGECLAGDAITCGLNQACDPFTGCSICEEFGAVAPQCSLDVCRPGHWLPKCHAAVAASAAHSCFVQSDGSLWCWGANDQGQSEPPSGTTDKFLRVCAGDGFSCAIRTDGTLACWGGGPGAATLPPGKFTEVGCGPDYACALTAAGAATCWGASGAPATGVLAPPGDAFKQVSGGGGVACGVKTNGDLKCWGSDSNGVATPPPGSFVQVALSQSGFGCAISTTGALTCWGSDSHQMVSGAPTSGPFYQVSVGGGLYKGQDIGGYACAVAVSGKTICWGGTTGPEMWDLPGETTITALAVGAAHACGLTWLGFPTCWGADADTALKPLTGSAKGVVCGDAMKDTSESASTCPWDWAGSGSLGTCGDGYCDATDGGLDWCSNDCWDYGFQNPCDSQVACTVFGSPSGYAAEELYFSNCRCDADCMVYGDCCQLDGSLGDKCTGSICSACNP